MRLPWWTSFGVGCFSLFVAAFIQGTAPSWIVYLNLAFWALNWLIAFFKWRDENGQ